MHLSQVNRENWQADSAEHLITEKEVKKQSINFSKEEKANFNSCLSQRNSSLLHIICLYLKV